MTADEAMSWVTTARARAVEAANGKPVSLDILVGMFRQDAVAARLLVEIWDAAGSPLCSRGRNYPDCTAALTIAFAVLLELDEPESPQHCDEHGRRLIANSAACHVLVDGRRELDS